MEKEMERPTGSCLKMLIWDFNGTMLDDLSIAIGSVEFIFRLYDKPVPSKDKFRSRTGRHFMEFYHGHGIPRWATADHLNVIRQDYYLARLNQVHFRPRLQKVLTWCQHHGLKLAICSGEIKAVLYSLLDREGLRKFFKQGGIRAEAWNGKERELIKLCGQFKISCRHAAYVDDTADGVRAAHRAGLQSIGFAHPTAWNTARHIEAVKPTHIVHDLRELQTLLEVLTR